MPGSVKVSGGAETARAFDQLAGDVRDLTETHHRVALARLDGVARRTPTRTGALASSWEATGSPTAGSISSPLGYAPPVEYGVPERGITAAAMVAQTLAADEAALLAEYERSILDRAKARGFRIA